MRNMLSMVVLAAVACGDDGGAPCSPIGSWTLTTTTTSGDCFAAGQVDTDVLVVADAGEAYTAQLVGPDGPVECEGAVAASCGGELTCAAGAGVTLRLALAFEGRRATGTAELVAAGECTARGNVSGSR